MTYPYVEPRPRQATQSAPRSDSRQSQPTSDALEHSKRSNSDTQAPPVMSGPTRMNRIARRAHEIYHARGGEHGKAIDDWLQAEREIDAEIDREQQKTGAERLP